MQVASQLTQVDLSCFDAFNAAVFKEVRSQLSGNDKKTSLFRNNMQTLIMVRRQLKRDVAGLL